jgi:hypothetical protein
MSKIQISGNVSPLERHFIENYAANKDRNVDDVGAALKEFKAALKTLPRVEALILAGDYVGVFNYLGGVLESMKDSTRLDAALARAKVFENALDAHARREPMNLSRAHDDWSLEQGRLLGLYQSASSDAKIIHQVENKHNKIRAIEILHNHIDDSTAALERETQELKSQIKTDVLLVRIEAAIKNGQQFVGLPTVDAQGKKHIRMVPTQYFTDDNMKPEDLEAYFG